VAAALALAEEDHAAARVQRRIPVAWRNVVSQPQRTRLLDGDAEVEVAWYGGRAGYVVEGATVVAASSTGVVLEVDGVTSSYDVLIATPVGTLTREVHVDGPRGYVRLREIPRFVDPADQVAAGSLLAPMPGTVVAVPVASGATVTAGDILLVLEAMKMQHSIKAPGDGVVDVAVVVGQQVAAGDVLAVVAAAETEGEDA